MDESDDSTSESDELHDHDPCIHISVSETSLPKTDQIGNPLRKAISEDNIEEIIKIVKGDSYKINLGDEVGNTCLHLAAGYASLKALTYFLSLENILINAQNHYGSTPLILALHRNDTFDAVCCLLNHNCDVNISNNENVTPLHIAAINEYLEIGCILLEKGAHLDAQDSDGYTPLHEAVRSENIEFICMLLYFNASVNEVTTYTKCTPFHFALKGGNQKIIDILIDYVDDFNYEDQFGETFLSIAVDNVLLTAFDILNRDFNNTNFPLGSIYCCFISSDVSLEWTWILLSKGVAVDLSDIEYFYTDKGFCKEIEAIFISETPIVFNNFTEKFIQNLVFNNCIVNIETNNCYASSLKQIARDAIRRVIFHKYQCGVNFKAYNVIMAMDIPEHLKDYLLLKRPISN